MSDEVSDEVSGDLLGRVAVVTGGTGGIGLHTAIALARAGAHLTVTGRDPARAAAAVERIQRDSGHDRVDVLLADMSQQEDVRRLAADLRSRHDRVDILVNNAGHVPATRTETVDGIESALAVNALAPFLLTGLLMADLRPGTPVRVVHVSGGSPVRIRESDLQLERRWRNGLTAYSHAKSVLLVLAHEQSRRLDAAAVTVNVAYPGFADTAMTRGIAGDQLPWFMRPLWPLMRRSMKQPEEVSRSSVSLALDPRWQGRTGVYLRPDTRERPWPRDARDATLRVRLWEAAEALTGLRTGSRI